MHKIKKELTVTLSVKNWTKFNPRTDVKTASWFRSEANMLEDPIIFELSHIQLRVWLLILCTRTKSRSDVFSINIKLACFLCKCSEHEFRTCIQKIEDVDLISICKLDNNEKHVHDRARSDADGSVPYETDETDETDETGRDEAKAKDCLKINLFEIWNTHRSELPEAKVFSDKRKKIADARIKENSNEDYWILIVKKLVESAFCNGKNDRGWKADIDFFLQPDTHIKAMEGKYDNRSSELNNSPNHGLRVL